MLWSDFARTFACWHDCIWMSAFRANLQPSDVVQEVLLKAVQAIDQYRGDSDAGTCRVASPDPREPSGQRRSRSGSRETRRRSGTIGAAAIDQSSIRLENWLVAEQSTPSLRAEFNEQLLLLAEAIDRLPEAQRQALTLHHLHGWKLGAISEHMQKSFTAVAGLIKRGLRQLREDLKPPLSDSPH